MNRNLVAGMALAALLISMPAIPQATVPVVSPSAENGRVLKAGPGYLYGATVTIGATTGYVMLLDAVAVPADGAVVPKLCIALPTASTTMGLSTPPGTQIRFTTGVTIVFSSTGCFTLTKSATAQFSGLVQ